MSPRPRILLLDDDRLLTRSLARLLQQDGVDVAIAHGPGKAGELLQTNSFDVLIAEPETLRPASAASAWLGATRLAHPHLVTILLTSHGNVDAAVEATRGGVFDYLTKPVDEARLRATVARALRQHHLLHEPDAAQRDEGCPIVGRDRQMLKLFESVDAVARSRATVLIVGESGTGKSVLARAIHGRSPRQARPFVEVSCGSLPETLLESELFGHVRGAFTGAVADKRGRFAMADGGTIFLDEINSATPLMQVKLLRVLQERAFEPVGSSQTRTVDTRTILATNADLSALVAQGAFRQDLFYRVNVVTLHVPPLRERVADIRLLAEHFRTKFARETGRATAGFSDDAMATLERYAWPGNIRELENAVERAVVLCRRPIIEPSDLPEIIRGFSERATADEGEPMRLDVALAGPEKRIIEAALRRNGWSRTQTARELGIDRTTLYKKMRKHGLGRRDAA